MEVSISVKDKLAILLSLRKNCSPNTKQDKNTNSRLKRPQGDCGKLDSLELLKNKLLSFLLDYLIQCSDVTNTEDPGVVATINHRAYKLG